MKKLSVITLIALLAVCFAFTNAFAQPSSKVSAGVRGYAAVPATKSTAAPGSWYSVFELPIKTPEQKDLFIDVSLEVGLTTNTKVMSKQLVRSLSTAEAQVRVRVLVDNQYAIPTGEIDEFGEYMGVTFSRRKQTLIAEFGGDFSTCETNEDGVYIIKDDCILDESLGLILDTMAAHCFVFVAPDISAGEHTIYVEAYVDYGADMEWTEDDQPSTVACIGNGTVAVDNVRMVKGALVPEI